MKKYLKYVFILLILIGCGSYFFMENISPDKKPPVAKLDIGVYRGEFSSLIWIAENQDYFRDSGLEVSIKEYASGVAPVKALLSGEIDIATAGEFVGVRFSFDHYNLKTIASIDTADAIEIIARKDRNIKHPADLSGKTIGLKMKSQAEFLIGRFLLFNQLSSEEVKIVDLNPDQMGEAISSGDVDAIMVWDPYTYRIKQLLGDNAISWEGQSDQDFYFLLMTRDDVIDPNPDVISRFLEALDRAEKFISNDESAAQRIIENRLGLEAGYLKTVWLKNSFKLSLPQEMILVMEDEARWVIGNSLTKRAEMPNYLNFIHLDGLLKVNPGAVTIVH